jgi:hypothetical protein
MGVAALGEGCADAVSYYHTAQHIDLQHFSNLSAGFN